MTVYDYVKILSDEQNMPISEVEKQCGLGNGTIKSWKTSYPKIDKIYSVAHFFQEPLEYFLNGIRSTITEDETIILNTYRNADAESKMKMIQLAMNIKDNIEKKNTETTEQNIG